MRTSLLLLSCVLGLSLQSNPKCDDGSRPKCEEESLFQMKQDQPQSLCSEGGPLTCAHESDPYQGDIIIKDIGGLPRDTIKVFQRGNFPHFSFSHILSHISASSSKPPSMISAADPSQASPLLKKSGLSWWQVREAVRIEK